MNSNFCKNCYWGIPDAGESICHKCKHLELINPPTKNNLDKIQDELNPYKNNPGVHYEKNCFNRGFCAAVVPVRKQISKEIIKELKETSHKSDIGIDAIYIETIVTIIEGIVND